MAYYGEQKRIYDLKWRAARRSQWINDNGPCNKCGSKDDLEIDHIEPHKKQINAAALWSLNELTRTKELMKCQVLCRLCHLEKTKLDLSVIFKDRPNPKLRKYSKEQYLSVMSLFYQNKMAARAIAKRLSIPRGTVSSWIYGDKLNDWFYEFRVSSVVEQTAVNRKVGDSSSSPGANL